MEEKKDEWVPPTTPGPQIPETPTPPPPTPPPTQPFEGGLSEKRERPEAYEGEGTMEGASPDD